MWDGLLTTMGGGVELPVPQRGAYLRGQGVGASPSLCLVLLWLSLPQTTAFSFSSWPNPSRPSRASSDPRPQIPDRPPLPPRSLVYPTLNAFIWQILIEHLHIHRKALGSKKPQTLLTRVERKKCFFSSTKVVYGQIQSQALRSSLGFPTHLSFLVIGWPTQPSGISSAFEAGRRDGRNVFHEGPFG